MPQIKMLEIRWLMLVSLASLTWWVMAANTFFFKSLFAATVQDIAIKVTGVILTCPKPKNQ
jgi:hypothetical protein